MIKKTMCIGCTCEGFIFTSIFGATRILGPVDNIHGYNFKSTLDVFNGKLFDAILTDKIDKKEENIWTRKEWDDDNYNRYYCSINGQWNWRTIHNNFEREDRKQLLRKRIDDFNKFNNEINDEYAYIYALSDGDEYLNEDDFNYVVNNLPSYVTDRLIIVSGIRFEIPQLFYNTFKCIRYNVDLNFTEQTQYTNQLWDKIFKFR